MNEKQEVENFLNEIRIKVSSGVADLIFLNGREKNAQALLDLEITPAKRNEIILKLKPEDFFKTESVKYLDKYEMHTFGKMVKGNEVYIKISITITNIVCISFHKAEFPIKYAFKK